MHAPEMTVRRIVLRAAEQANLAAGDAFDALDVAACALRTGATFTQSAVAGIRFARRSRELSDLSATLRQSGLAIVIRGMRQRGNP